MQCQTNIPSNLLSTISASFKMMGLSLKSGFSECSGVHTESRTKALSDQARLEKKKPQRERISAGLESSALEDYWACA